MDKRKEYWVPTNTDTQLLIKLLRGRNHAARVVPLPKRATEASSKDVLQPFAVAGSVTFASKELEKDVFVIDRQQAEIFVHKPLPSDERFDNLNRAVISRPQELHPYTGASEPSCCIGDWTGHQTHPASRASEDDIIEIQMAHFSAYAIISSCYLASSNLMLLLPDL
ncbi:hypothetical protein ACLOJK_031375 [Asimina triloba]